MAPLHPTSISTLRRPVLLTLQHVAPMQWSVASRDGRLGGTFTTRKAALHYAREEAVALPRAVLVMFGDNGSAVSETYEAHVRVRVSAIAALHARVA